MIILLASYIFCMVKIVKIAVCNSIFYVFTCIPKHPDLRPLIQVNEYFKRTIGTIGTYKRVFLENKYTIVVLQLVSAWKKPM